MLVNSEGEEGGEKGNHALLCQNIETAVEGTYRTTIVEKQKSWESLTGFRINEKVHSIERQSSNRT